MDLLIYKLAYYKQYKIPVQSVLILLKPSSKANNFYVIDEVTYNFTLIELSKIEADKIINLHIVDLFPWIP
ncbi:MAG: hypothetical protein KatS3mg129_0994 [Leptospiraceae bacterium]|nr:MAG: hypothetical protein KatS3mg129_0994 [Leptospiraceae bacterium]